MLRHSILTTTGFMSLLLTAPLPAQTSFNARWQVQQFAAGESAPTQVTTHLESRRRDGSVVRTTTVASPSGEQGQVIEIINVAKRQKVRVEPFTGSKTTTAISAAEVLLLNMSAEACKQNAASSDMQSTRMGRNVVLEIVNQPEIAASVSGWLAPELGCTALESTLALADGSHTDRIITSLDMNEPAAAIFEPPQGLVERTSAEVEQALRQKFGN